MKNLYALYCRVYADLLSWLECHQPGVGGMRLPDRVIVSRVQFRKPADDQQGGRDWRPTKR